MLTLNCNACGKKLGVDQRTELGFAAVSIQVNDPMPIAGENRHYCLDCWPEIDEYLASKERANA
jgi:hypothetical protein